MSTLAAGGQELRSTNRPIYGASMITMNNIMYIYGGFYNVPPWNKEALWTLSNSIDKLSQLNTDPYSSPAVIYNTLQSIDNKTMYSFGGHLDSKDIMKPPIGIELLRYYKFDLQILKWTPLQKKNGTIPLERFWHTTVQLNESIYLFGGMNITHGLINDFWKYNPILDSWINLNYLKQQQSRCGHTSTITNDGKMIVLGGFDCTNASFISPKRKELFPLSNAAIFDTINTQWYDQPLKGDILPVPRTFHTAIKSNASDDKIIICGGQDGEMEPFQTYISGNQMIAILDLNTWQWILPQVKKSLYQPFSRSFAVASLVNETKMVYGLGLNYHTVYDGFYVFNLETNNWMATENESLIDKGILKIAEHIMISTKLVIGLSVFGSVLCLALFTYWIMTRHRTSLAIFLMQVRKSIWNRRQGEPVWAEISRFLFRFLFLAIFIIISAVLVLQIENSPIIDQIHHDENTLTNAPDIRFCFDGWIDPSPQLQCITDFGQSCNQHVQNITQKIESNLNYYGSKLTCYLFTGEHVYLGNNRLTHNGTQIQFYYDEQIGNNRSILHVEFYHPLHDPNKPIYNISGSFDTWYSKDESAKFQADEQANLKTENVYNIDPHVPTQISYEFTKREKINLTAWNYIGFGTKRETIHQIKTTKTHHTKDSTTLQLYVYPSSYNTIVIREQRAFTIIHGMGIIGGIFGLMIGIQVNLFGYRPRSPWGIVHRWSIGLMRRSLLNGLRSKFSNHVDIPIIHPVHRRYSMKSPIQDDGITIEEDDDDEDKRMMKLEERLYVFEMLFQAYYIDDEVFRSLSTSTR